MAKKRTSLIMGIDEAGRGPVIGPLVVCGLMAEEKDLPTIEAMGLKDSKKLTPRKREEFAAILKDKYKYELSVLPPYEIDARFESEDNLNQLEVNCFAGIIRSAKPTIAYLDACDVNAERFGLNVKKCLDFELEIVSAHEADSKYPIVSAASIIAKVHRDSLIREISEKMGEDVGSGYPADPVTKTFLKNYYMKHKCLPDCARKTWKTSHAVIADCLQARLFQFE
ncbi:ribonuclease HII [Methanocella sp. MCL-LM]|uniref:ribonuclease HII n=1 Tax=Methanocella sp. MCL-LM TaxID=3412035 RepID=UPI003C7361F5